MSLFLGAAPRYGRRTDSQNNIGAHMTAAGSAGAAGRARPSDRDALPRRHVADPPAPPAFSARNLFKVIGPGAVMAATSIGGGEWRVKIPGQYCRDRHGRGRRPNLSGEPPVPAAGPRAGLVAGGGSPCVLGLRRVLCVLRHSRYVSIFGRPLKGDGLKVLGTPEPQNYRTLHR